MTRSCLSLAVLVLVAPALALGQSLGEIARKEAERREKNKEQGVEARVIGENELDQARTARYRESGDEDAGSSETSETTNTAPSRPARSSNDESEQQRKQEHEWRSRAALAEARVEKAKKRYEKLRSMWIGYGRYYTDEKGRAVITSPEQLQRMTARAKADFEAAEEALEELRERARREGIPPGWLR